MRSVNATVDGIVTEITKHISDMEQAKLDGDLPQDMLFSYSNMLSNLIGRGEEMLRKFEVKNNTLVTILSNLSQASENSTEKRAVDDLRHQLMANFSTCREKLRKMRLDNRHLLPGFCSSEPAVVKAVSASVLLQLVNLRPADPLAKKIKVHLVEKMELQHDITSLDEVNAFVHSEDGRVNTVDEMEEQMDLPKMDNC